MTRCQTCDRPIPAGSPAGHCPRCLLASGLRRGAASAPLSLEVAADLVEGREVRRLIGRGGMGAVFEAYDPRLGRPVAIKVLDPGLADDPEFLARFAREAQALALLQHPNLIQIHALRLEAELPYLELEFVPGGDLRARLRRGPLELREALEVLGQVAAGLAQAHAAGLVHRDLKPENVLLPPEQPVRLVDFGLASAPRPEGELSLTRSGQVLGTAHYMAPEQLDAPGEVDARADVFAWGVLAYEVLTGRLPRGRFPAPRELVSLPPALDALILSCLESEPSRRPAEGAALVHALRGGQPAAASESSGWAGVTAGLVAAFALLVAFLIALFLLGPGSPEPRRAQPTPSATSPAEPGQQGPAPAPSSAPLASETPSPAGPAPDAAQRKRWELARQDATARAYQAEARAAESRNLSDLRAAAAELDALVEVELRLGQPLPATLYRRALVRRGLARWTDAEADFLAASSDPAYQARGRYALGLLALQAHGDLSGARQLLELAAASPAQANQTEDGAEAAARLLARLWLSATAEGLAGAAQRFSEGAPPEGTDPSQLPRATLDEEVSGGWLWLTAHDPSFQRSAARDSRPERETYSKANVGLGFGFLYRRPLCRLAAALLSLRAPQRGSAEIGENAVDELEALLEGDPRWQLAAAESAAALPRTRPSAPQHLARARELATALPAEAPLRAQVLAQAAALEDDLRRRRLLPPTRLQLPAKVSATLAAGERLYLCELALPADALAVEVLLTPAESSVDLDLIRYGSWRPLPEQEDQIPTYLRRQEARSLRGPGQTERLVFRSQSLDLAEFYRPGGSLPLAVYRADPSGPAAFTLEVRVYGAGDSLPFSWRRFDSPPLRDFSHDAKIGAAKLRAARGEWAEADQALAALAEEGPAWIAQQRAALLAARGDFAGALALLAPHTEASLPAQIAWARWALAAGRADEGLAALRLAVRIDYRSLAARELLLAALAAQGQVSALAKALDEVRALEPAEFPQLELAAWEVALLSLRGEDERARERLRELVAAGLGFPTLGAVLRQVGQPQLGLRMLDQSDYPEGRSLELDLERARLARASGDPQRARRLLEACLKRLPDDWRAGEVALALRLELVQLHASEGR